MNKTTVVISAAVATLVLLILGGVVYGVQARANQAVQQNSAQDAAFQEAAPLGNALQGNTAQENNPELPPLSAEVQSEEADTSPDVASALSPQEIASQAAHYINRTDVYSIESVILNGQTQYLVTFSSGDIVRLDASGQVLSVESPQPSNGPTWDDDDHDDHDEHEEHEEDEDHEEQESGGEA